MKTWKSILAVFAVAGLLATGLTACGKKDESAKNGNNLTRGSLSSDGNVVNTNSVIGGYQASISISNIQMYGNQYGQQQYGGGYYDPYYSNYQYGGYNSSPTLNFQATINGQSRSYQTQANVGGGYDYYGSMQYDFLGGYNIEFEAACYQYTCDDVVLHVLISNSNNGGYGGYGVYETKQIAIRKSMRENRIVNMVEYQVSGNQIRTIDQLMREL